MHVTLVIGALCLVAGAAAAPKEKIFKRLKDAPSPQLAQSSPTFDSFGKLGFDSNVQKSNKDLLALNTNKLGFSPFDARQGFGNVVDLQ
uniref:Uncharacterized protein n=1 Tax=Romanomermis culicivorax TaxID=13658 RepID=A0A915KYZ3_ROMCU